MSGTPDSAGPKLYHRPMSKWWWLQSRVYFLFIVRELTCIFVGYFALVMMWLIHALGQGPDAYAQFTAWMQTRTFSVLNSVALVFLLFHSISGLPLRPGQCFFASSSARTVFPTGPSRAHCTW